MNTDFSGIGDILKNRQTKKAPAYRWQDLALRVIKELNIPPFKKSSVFKICKDNSENFVLKCLNDTKELCDGKDKWRYFFKAASAGHLDKEKKINKIYNSKLIVR